MPLLFYLFTFVINLWHWKFVTADVSLQCLRRGQNFHKKCVFEGVHSKKMTDEFLAKSWTKHGVNKVFKKLRDTGTVERRPGSGRPHSACTEENAKLLLQKFSQSATDFVLPVVGWNDQEHLSVLKDKVSGILRELLKQKVSVLHASSTVRVCQLLCTAPLETFQMQVSTNNLDLGQRRPMNTRLPWYLTDSPVGLRLVLLTRD